MAVNSGSWRSSSLPPRLTPERWLVLNELAKTPSQWLYAEQLRKTTGLARSSVRAVLTGLRDRGWLKDRWEDADPVTLGRPQRRYYCVNPQRETDVHAALRRGPLEGDKP